MLIGKKIKELRSAKKITLTELAVRSGVQIATLSRIENEKMVGTIECHMNIARALGVDLTDLYKDAPSPPETETSPSDSATSETFTYNKTAAYEMLTKNVLSKKMMPILLRIEPNGQTNPEQNVAGSERFIFVLEGEIDVCLGSKVFPLTPTNTLYFAAAEKHYFVNRSSTPARILSVTTPVSL